MEKTLNICDRSFSRFRFVCLALFGCGLITLSSFVRIPFFPVPFTLQTFAIFFLALTQSPSQAFASTICYLTCASFGLPVFGGASNPLWIMGKCGGYLVAFPIAAYLTSKMIQKKCPSLVAILCGQMVIYALGLAWLIPLFGFQIAFMKGVVFFIPSDLLKGLIAFGMVAGWKRWRQSRESN
jgi:biotin transport system substrate-specific component